MGTPALGWLSTLPAGVDTGSKPAVVAESWLQSLPAAAEVESGEPITPEPRAVPAPTPPVDDAGEADSTAPANEAKATVTDGTEDSLVAMGFAREAVIAALQDAAGDFDEALAALSREAARQKGADRQRESTPTAGEPFEVDGAECVLQETGELTLRLPLAPSAVGPIVGRRRAGGDGLVFNGMDDWLWELYESHPPRPSPLPASFDAHAAAAALEDGAPYVWDDFASLEEVRAGRGALEAMFTRGELARGSASWVDECADGGHARNRRTLEGQHRDDACGFWDIRDGVPAPPPAILALFRRLEAAGEQFCAEHKWPLLCSRLGMGAVYDGQGACYRQHRDNEWQRHLRPWLPGQAAGKRRRQHAADGACTGEWMNFRELTMLAYVNLPEDYGEDERGLAAGGRLRCYVGTARGDLAGRTARELRDVAPVGGRAIIFRSRELLHEVLPSFARRYCLTLWFCTPP